MVRKNPNHLMIWRTIKSSLGRYLAILAIIALGSGVFAGLCVSSDAMIKTGDIYYRTLRFSDYTAMSTLGFTEDDVNAARSAEGVVDAEGAVSADVLFVDEAAVNHALKVHTITDRVNRVNLIAGRMPTADNECLLDANNMDQALLGTSLTVSDDTPEETREMLKHTSYQIVGLITSPYYLNEERGSTTLGAGTLSGFVYLPPDGFTTDYFTEIYVSFGSETPEIYSDAYDEYADSLEPKLEEALEVRAELRYSDIVSDAEAEISDGEQELADGKEALEQERLDALQKLDDAKLELEEARATLEDGWSEYENGRETLRSETASAEEGLRNAAKTLEEAKLALEEAENIYTSGKAELDAAEASYEEGLLQYEAGLAEYEAGAKELEAGRKELEAGEQAYETGIQQLSDGKTALDAAKAELETAKAQLDAAEAQFSGVLAFQTRADQILGEMRHLGYSYESTDEFAAALTAASGVVGSEEAIRYQTIYQLSQSILQAMSLTPETLIASAGSMNELQKGMLLTVINQAGANYGLNYPDFDAYLADLTAASAFIGSDNYRKSISLIQAADSVLQDYISDYDGSTGIQGFLTDWNYYQAVCDALASNLGCGSDPGSIRAALDAAAAEYDAGMEQYEAGLAAYQENAALLEESRRTLDAGWAELEAGEAELEDAANTLREAKAELDAGKQELESGKAELQSGREELDRGWAEYESGVRQLEDGRAQLKTETEQARTTLQDALEELQNGEKAYQDGLKEYEDGVHEFESEIAEAEETIAENEALLRDAREELSELEPATLYLLNRDTNIGYACFKNDAQIIDGIARVFPIFFFLVAALVCITTMTRMVEDDRTQIGVMKALGYGKWQISKKYLIYSGSASLLGCIVGLLLGMWVIPFVLWQAYSMIYEFSDIQFYFDGVLALLCTLGYLGCSLGVTWFACRAELQDAPANLIRPKAPKAGKRIFLEHIPFLWKHLNFLYKVSLRNVFRYKKRLFMMLLGIGGCTGLLLTGFGVQDSIQDFANYQFDDISLYDGVVNFDAHLDEAAQAQFLEDCGTSVKDAVFLHVSNVDLSGKDYVSTASLVAAYGDLNGFIDFHDGSEPLDYPEAGNCMISRGLSERLGYAVGDTISLRDADLNEMLLHVSAVYDNYVDYYIFTVPESLEHWSGGDEINAAYVNYPENADSYACTADVVGAEHVAHVMDSASQRDRVNTMMSSLNYIVALIVVCAGTLAFIVLYNLTNINISERIREIATLKVLGFYAAETSSYVFRENIILTTMGAFVGLFLGKLLHAYVMNQIKVDGVLFDIRVMPTSYLMAFAMTIVFAWLVNSVMYFKIKKINMTESLKSVE